MLEFLIRNRQRVVSKDELIQKIWDGRSVSDAALTTRMNAARRAIDDTGQAQRLIKTLPRKGFRFVGTALQSESNLHETHADHRAQPLVYSQWPADIPSIAVLRFENLSGDPDQEYFADGIVEDIITGLSRSKLLFVISRNSSFANKNRPVHIRQVGRDLGVQYVLEGSVRKSGSRIRVTGQLTDTSSSRNMWADKFECDFADLFESQDRLASSVLGAVLPQLERAEIDRSRCKPPDSLQAYDQYLRSKHSTYLWTRAGNVDALKFARLAISLDSEFPAVHAHAANLFGQRKAFGWVDDIDAERAESRSLIERALQLDQDDPLVLAHAAQVYSYTLEEPESGLAYAIKATLQDPNLVMAHLWAGWAKVYLGDHEASIEEFLVAIRLSPIDPHLFLPLTGMAYAHFFCGNYEQSLSWAARAIQRQPNFPGARRIQMSSLAITGAQADAQSVRASLACIDGDLRISNINRTPFRRSQDIEKLTEAWRIAGVGE